jgi:hypothetical protein
MTHANAPRTRRTPTSTDARRRHAASFSDAVVAAYIHEISARHRPPRPIRPPDARRR